MAFDIIVPKSGASFRAAADQVRVSIGKSNGKNPITELRIVIGPLLVERLGFKKGQCVNLAFGSEASAERGQMAIMPTTNGHFRFSGSGKGLKIITRTLHPTLRLAAHPSTAAAPVQLIPEKLIVRMPDAFMAPRPMGSIMGDPPVPRKA
ncbi:hypothetical protein ABMY26_32145 [Azospirillum sp. HJ39]|uniref:hypothetical protein n=1 Tax=Azospirillum sp. HJ39 TaxID=3159496 RepID=UPI0035561196